jgi:hypothetical protein
MFFKSHSRFVGTVRMVFGHPARAQADFAFWFHTFIVALDMSA